MNLFARPPFDTLAGTKKVLEPIQPYVITKPSYYRRSALLFTLEYLHNKFRDDYERDQPIYRRFVKDPRRSVSVKQLRELNWQANADSYWQQRRREFARPLINYPEFVKLKPQVAPKMSGCGARPGFRRQYRAIADGLE